MNSPLTRPLNHFRNIKVTQNKKIRAIEEAQRHKSLKKYYITHAFDCQSGKSKTRAIEIATLVSK